MRTMRTNKTKRTKKTKRMKRYSTVGWGVVDATKIHPRATFYSYSAHITTKQTHHHP